jgi:hypothetical protein
MTSGSREKSSVIDGSILWSRCGDDLDQVGVKIDVGRALAQEIGKQLSSAHANSVVSMLAERHVFEILSDPGGEPLVELKKKPLLAESRGFEESRPSDFFFMRFIIRAPRVLALLGVTVGWSSR